MALHTLTKRTPFSYTVKPKTGLLHRVWLAPLLCKIKDILLHILLTYTVKSKTVSLHKAHPAYLHCTIA